MKLKGNSRGKLQEGQGGLSGPSPLRSKGTRGNRAEKLGRLSGVQRHSNESRKKSLGSQGTY
jgi:hypothetical protein